MAGTPVEALLAPESQDDVRHAARPRISYLLRLQRGSTLLSDEEITYGLLTRVRHLYDDQLSLEKPFAIVLVEIFERPTGPRTRLLFGFVREENTGGQILGLGVEQLEGSITECGKRPQSLLPIDDLESLGYDAPLPILNEVEMEARYRVPAENGVDQQLLLYRLPYFPL